jgi:hypothetical protein
MLRTSWSSARAVSDEMTLRLAKRQPVIEVAATLDWSVPTQDVIVLARNRAVQQTHCRNRPVRRDCSGAMRKREDRMT